MTASDFLQKYRPGGPWVLTAISLDRKSLPTETFTDPSKVDEWVKTQNEKLKHNVYFHVNPAIKEAQKKLDREDILEVSYLHVDIDPPKGQPSDQYFRDSTLNMLLDNRPKGVPEPSIVVFSGGGFAAFWRLKEPIPVNGDIGLAEDAKLYNKHLEVLFGADNCHNIDRLMRLPYTTNIPDAKKKKAGRTEETAKVLRFNDYAYDLKEFKKHSVSSSNIAGKSVNIPSGDIRRIEDIDELDEYDVPQKIKVICVQGMDHENPKEKDNSRSAWLFHALCGLIKCKVPDEIIFSIITDPGFLVSESILDLGDKAESEAIRQIKKAKEACVDKRLYEFNSKYAVIGNMGGKCRIIEEILDHNTGRYQLSKQSFADFANRYMNKYVRVGTTKGGDPKYEGAGKWWLQHPDRRQFDRLVFAPGREVENCYNLWRGFSVSSKPGDCSMYLDHIKRNICAEDQECYDYLIRWMARAVQHPDQQGCVAIVMKGEKGTGKSVFADEFGAIFGRHYISVSNASHLTGNFNAHLRDSVVVFADEAFHWTDKKHESTLKTLITEDTLMVEAKSVDAEISPNFVHLIMASNNDHVISASGLERRFLVLDVAKNNCQDRNFFQPLLDQMRNGGREALLHYLLNFDLTGFDVFLVPQTGALQEQKKHSLSLEEEWWYSKLNSGQILDGDDEWRREVKRDDLTQDFIDNARKFNHSFRGTATKLGMFLKKIIPDLNARQVRCTEMQFDVEGTPIGEKKVKRYYYDIADLSTCRKHWESLYRGTEEWEYQEERLPFE